MKNNTYNTGRTVTINLDNLGNADIWQLFQILTDHTGNAFYGNEEEASPAADPDAACEVFLHIAETADDRADGADPVQKLFLQGIKEEYKEIFETDPADDLRERLERHAANAEEEPEEDDRTGLEVYLDMATQAYLDDPANKNLDAALQANARDAENDPTNLYRAGVFAGLAEAAAWGIYNRPEIAGRADDIDAIKEAVYRAYHRAW